MRNFTLLFFFFLSLYIDAQQHTEYYDYALSKRLDKYNERIDEAIASKDSERATFLFDSLFTNHLKNTYVPNLNLNKIKGGTFSTDQLDIPFVIVTKSTWFLQEADEVRMINDFARRYKDQIKIIMIFWGDKKACKKLARSYNSQVITTYIDEKKNKDSHITSIFKHAFGAPVCYFVSDTKQMTFIDKTFSLTSSNLQINSLEDTTKQLALLLFKDESTDNGIFTTIEEGTEEDKTNGVEN